jgi:hypothetical protein
MTGQAITDRAIHEFQARSNAQHPLHKTKSPSVALENDVLSRFPRMQAKLEQKLQIYARYRTNLAEEQARFQLLARKRHELQQSSTQQTDSMLQQVSKSVQSKQQYLNRFKAQLCQDIHELNRLHQYFVRESLLERQRLEQALQTNRQLHQGLLRAGNMIRDVSALYLNESQLHSVHNGSASPLLNPFPVHSRCTEQRQRTRTKAKKQLSTNSKSGPLQMPSLRSVSSDPCQYNTYKLQKETAENVAPVPIKESHCSGGHPLKYRAVSPISEIDEKAVPVPVPVLISVSVPGFQEIVSPAAPPSDHMRTSFSASPQQARKNPQRRRRLLKRKKPSSAVLAANPVSDVSAVVSRRSGA